MSTTKKDPHADEFGINPAKLAWATRRKANPKKFGKVSKAERELIKIAKKRNKEKQKKKRQVKPKKEKITPTNSTKEEKCFVCGLPDSEDHKNLRHEFSTTELIKKKPTEMSSS